MPLTFTLEKHQDVIDAINGDRRGLVAGATPPPMTFGVDVSHWQGSIDFRKVKAAGFSFVVMKATQGVGYVDPNFRVYRANVRATPPLIPLMYHFVGTGDPAAEADFFIKTVGPLQTGEGIAEDYEPANPPANPPAWSKTWLDRTKAVLGASPWIYMNSSTEARYNWSPLASDYGMWLAKYDNDPDMDPVVHWPGLAAEQYWDKATVPGISGPVDVDVFYGTTAQLLAYCKGGTPTPVPEDNVDIPQIPGVWKQILNYSPMPGDPTVWYLVGVGTDNKTLWAVQFDQKANEGAGAWGQPYVIGSLSLA